MDNFIVSARKYRPNTFKSVVGQDSITSTLKNSIKLSHLAHAYLFCGPRGVGKTTCARIYAKTINCQNITEEFEACNQCESCKAFNNSSSFNIHELDAASNNSVDDIRNLIDQVRIPPQIGDYSIYIIDEVHMLSQQAFNAFLKTLEEPPRHAIFILATTEKHKIIPTILSRCQIFDFNRIKVDDITNHLKFVAEKEKVTADVNALQIISQKADGALRDALSMFDQIVSFSGDKITYENVIENLNVLDYVYYFRLVDAFKTQNISETLLILNDILDRGFNLHFFINGLSEHLRNILVCKDSITIDLLELGEKAKQEYLKYAETTDMNFIFSALYILNKTDINYKASTNKRLFVELALIQICNINNITAKTSNVITPQKKTERPSKVRSSVTDNKQVSTFPEKKVQDKVEEPLKIAKSTPSIKDAILGIKTEKKVDNSKKEFQEKIINEFSQQDLESAWKKYTNNIKTDDPRLFNTLSTGTPTLKDNYLITFDVLNQSQINTINLIKREFTLSLKQDLNNSELKIEIILNTQESTEKKPYTPEEKYEYLHKKNPKLNNLSKQLDLGIS